MAALAASLIAATAPPAIAGAALENSVPVVQAGPDASTIVGQAFTQGGFTATVYQTDFSGAVDPVWSVTTKSVTPSGRPFLGEFAQKTVTLDLGNLPTHGAVTISADVYIIRTWDGNMVFLAGIGIIGPDFFDLNVAGGQTLLHTTFSNIDNTEGWQQAYPDSIPAGVTDPAAFPSHPARAGAFAVQTLGYDRDTTYRLTYTVPHTAGSIAFNFVGAPNQDITDESWGLGRVQVSVSTPGPFFVDPDANTWTGTVNYGDGTGTQPLALNSDKTFGLSHAYGHAGTYTVTATVNDNAGGVGTGTMAVTVNKADTTTTVASSLNPSAVGQQVTFTATVSANAPGGGTPAGTVQFKDGGVDLGAPVALANGSASLSTSSLAVGAHSITAVYSGNGDYNASTSAALTQTVEDPFVVFGTNSVVFREGSQVLSGDVGAPNAASGKTLDGHVTVSIGAGAIVPAGSAVYADSIRVKAKGVVDTAYFNTLGRDNDGDSDDGQGTIVHVVTPLPAGVTAPSVPGIAGSAGTQDVVVNGNKEDCKGATCLASGATLAPGAYGDLRLRGGEEKRHVALRLQAGDYFFESIDLGAFAELRFNRRARVFVAMQMDTGQHSFIGPSEGSGMTAKDIVFVVGGINGRKGKLGSHPKSVEIGERSEVHASIAAPNGTIRLRQRTTATGAFIARDVEVGEKATVAFDSAF